MKLTLCMIVKNEQEYLAECLSSIRSVVDEIIIVDTGSTDSTIAIAQQFTSNTYQFEWIDDFSEARNFSIDHASGDWILVLDPDERISSKDHHSLRNLMEQKDIGGYRFCKRKYIQDATGISGWTKCNGEYPEEKTFHGWTGEWQTRLFRNDSRIRFEGHVHECVEHSLYRHNLILKTSLIPIHHYSMIRNKHRLLSKQLLYAKLGRKKIQAMPDSSQAHYELAIQLLELKETEEAITLLKKAVQLDSCNKQLWETLGLAYQDLQQLDEALTCFLNALKTTPNNANLLNNIASIYIQLNKDDDALTILEKSLFIHPNLPETLYNIAAVFYRKERYDTALNFISQLIELNPEHYRALVLKGQIELATDQTDKAIMWFYEAIRIKPDYYEPYYYLASFHLSQGDNAEAVDMLEKAWELSDHHFKIGTDLAQLFITQQNFIEAEHILSIVVKDHPDYQPSHKLLDTLHYYNQSPHIKKPPYTL